MGSCFVISEKIAIFAHHFFVMSTELNQQLEVLNGLIDRLKDRCLQSEALARSLQQQVADLEARLAQSEAEKAELSTKYSNLQSGLAATGADAEKVQLLKEQYLALVSEIDACIATLQHG